MLEFAYRGERKEKITTFNVYYGGSFYGCVLRYENLTVDQVTWRNDESGDDFTTRENAAKALVGSDWQED